MPASDSSGPPRAVRVAATGDMHCRGSNRAQVLDAFAALDASADLALLAGDLTGEGRLDEAEVLCEAAERTSVPVFAVLGNHDWHGGRAGEISERLRASGIVVLEREAARCEIDGIEVGVVGAKGFVGGVAPRHMPDFGEPSLRALYAETGTEVEGIDAGLREVATCAVRIVLLHYAPIEATLAGEPREIFVFLGSDRLAAPILEHGPDLVVHGHAHVGSPEGRIGASPVHNVSRFVTGTDFHIFELTPEVATGPVR